MYTSLQNPNGESCSNSQCDDKLTFADGTLFKYLTGHMVDVGVASVHACTEIDGEGEMEEFNIYGTQCSEDYKAVCQFDCNRDPLKRFIRYPMSDVQKDNAIVSYLTLSFELFGNVDTYVMVCARQCQNAVDGLGNPACNGFVVDQGVCRFGFVQVAFVQGLDQDGNHDLYFSWNV